MREKQVEAHLVTMCKKNNLLVRKSAWIGINGCPDRIIMTPALTVWVELKAPGKEPRVVQRREHARMRAAGQTVWVADSLESVDDIIDKILAANKKHREAKNGN